MKLSKLALVALMIGLSFTSCESVDDAVTLDQPQDDTPLADYEKGIIITNEGNFTQGNASVTFVSESFEVTENEIFNTVNSKILGDTAQSMAFTDTTAYIIVNGSNTIEIVNRFTFESIGTIASGLSNPRFMAISNGKGYITNWGDFQNTTDDYVAVLDLTTNEVSTTIPVDYLPEEIIANDNSVYVATGVFDNGNKINVINSITDEVEPSITVGDNPDSMQFDVLGNLWVLCQGNSSFSTAESAGQLMKIDTVDNTVLATLDFELTTQHPKYLQTNNNTLYYYLDNAVYEFPSTNTTLPTNPEITDLNFYDMSVKGDKLYGVDAGDFSSPGELQVYDLDGNSQLHVIPVGINPGEVYFNE